MTKQTELKDKNGKIICKGDILKGSFFGMGGEWTELAIVEVKRRLFKTKLVLRLFQNGNGIYDFTHPKFSSENRRKVIGSIYENTIA